MPWPTYPRAPIGELRRAGTAVPCGPEPEVNMVKCDDEGPFRQIYAVGRAGSRTPDPYDSQGVQLQVRVDLQLHTL